MFYSYKTPGFYPKLGDFPSFDLSDAVEITDEQHAALLLGLSNGKAIVADKRGAPVLIDKSVDLAAQAREARVPLLAAADLAINKAEDNGVDATPLRKYRQALRDISTQKKFPNKIDWPVTP